MEIFSLIVSCISCIATVISLFLVSKTLIMVQKSYKISSKIINKQNDGKIVGVQCEINENE